MIIRSKAPLRLGLAGGGTDVSPYSEKYGGCVLNSTISLYAHATIIPNNGSKIILKSFDLDETLEFNLNNELPIDGNLDLLKGVYNYIVREYGVKELAFTLTTSVDAPPGSGLGSSSTLVVAILGAFVEWLDLPLGNYEIANIAFEIERKDLGMSGGKQDQYAAAFGGFNFMEFSSNSKVIVNPLRVKKEFINELEESLLLFYLGQSRNSSDIIDKLTKNTDKALDESLEAMHGVKTQALNLKRIILENNLLEFGKTLDKGWKFKKKMATGITNKKIDEIYNRSIASGSLGGRISGAGGGGFMLFCCPINTKFNVIKSLEEYNIKIQIFDFVDEGLNTWKSNLTEEFEDGN